MGMIDWLAARLGYVKPAPRRGTGYAAAEASRLTASLAAETDYINRVLRYQLRALRARSRQAAQNNPFARQFASAVVRNVCGAKPFTLQAKVHYRNGRLDTSANQRIEQAWASWSRAGQCEITTRWSWAALQRLLTRSLVVDGEVLLRVYRGPEYGRHAYRLQLVDVDRLDEQKDEQLAGGGAIHMGVEMDGDGRPVAYHLLKRKPRDYLNNWVPREYERVPADEIIHLYVPDFAEQVRGVPWMYAALINLVHLGAFEEAAVIAARVGATQMGIITSPDGEAPALGQSETAQGEPQISAEPGTFPVLPQGYELSPWNPKYPDAAIEPFVKAILRGVAVGCDMAYHNLAGDMEGVNYSSARIAELGERDGWMMVQSFLVEHLHERLYEDWLRMQILTGVLPFDAAQMAKYRECRFQPRRWMWIDPLKEINAHKEAIALKVKSRTRVAAEAGEDIEDVFDEIAQEEALAEEKNITLTAAAPPAAAPTQEIDDDESTDE